MGRHSTKFISNAFNDWLRNMNLTSHSMIYTLSAKRAKEYAQQVLEQGISIDPFERKVI